MGSYVPTTAAEREEMLAAIGVKSLEDLYQAVPQGMLLNGTLNIPEGMSELEVREAVTAMAEKNKVYKTVLRGAGAYRHFIPAVVKSITSREELVTCYTPYQAEISQGVLQGTFEFQTMICELTGMDVANASHYDGATAAAETIPMCRDRKRTKAYVSACVNPQVIEVMQTYCFASNTELTVVPARMAEPISTRSRPRSARTPRASTSSSRTTSGRSKTQKPSASLSMLRARSSSWA